jgi:DNA-binding response OmpR family regulator
MVRKRRIFVVEDHPSTAAAVKRYLEVSGYRVELAGDVRSALRFARTKRFDVLVCDLHLPDGNGWDLLIKLRRRHAVTAIAFSALDGAEVRRRSKEAGFAEHVPKGSDGDVLVEAIDRLTKVKAA